MKQWMLSLSCVFLYSAVSAQAFLGLYGTDNSVLEIRENPAFTVHEDRAQLNFAGAAGEIGGNSIIFRKSIFNFVETGNATMDKDYYRSFDQHSKSMWANIEIMGPGASVIVKKKYFFAITTGARYLMNSDNLDDRFFRRMGVNAFQDTNLVDSFKLHNFAITSQVFSEFKLSYGGFFYESEDYKLVGGVTAKILTGKAAAALGIPDVSFKTYNNDGLAHNVIGTANVAFTPYANKWAITNNPFKAYSSPSNNIGLGLDLGLVYYMNPNQSMMPKKGYITRLAASITDIGSISYSSSSTTGSYSVNNKNINFKGIENNTDVTFGTRIFNDYLVDTTATPTKSERKFKIRLPTALHLNGDFKVEDRIFVNANVLINLRNPSADKFSNHYITTLTVTPRYMIKNFAVSMPFTFNVQKQGYLGLIVFAGPVYVGSGSLLQMATSQSINNLNLFLGANLRIKQKKQKVKDMMMM